MPGAPDTLDAAEDQGSRVLLMKSKAALYSSQGLLSGMLALYRDRLVWNEVSNRSSNMLTISMDVMFGATLSPPGKFKFKSFEAASVANLKIESSTHFTVYTIMSRENGKRPLCDTWSFKVDDEDECAMWISLLRCAIRPKLEDAEAKALVFLNPISGRRKGQKLFDSIVKPIFEIGCTPYTLIVTESASHAAEFIEHEDLGSYSCVVAMGGDGILHDILNGFLRRSDWPKFKSLPLGAIPAGTGNGLAKSLDCLWPEQAAVAVVKAQSRPLDIMSAALANGRTEYCFLSMTWGLIADIDIESERMRWAGPARLDLYGTIRLMSLRYYGGRLHYLPAIDHEPNNGESGAESLHAADTHGLMRNDNGCSVSNLADRTNQGLDEPWGLPAPSFSSPLVRRDSPKLQPTRSSLSPNIQPAVTLHPTLTAGIQLPITQGSLPPRWKTVEGPFAQVIATNVPWLSASFLACQRARISDGTIDLVYSGAVSKWQILPYISSSTRDNFMNTDGVQHAKVRAFILEPTGLRTTNRSAESHRAIQKPDHHPVKSSGNGARPISMPIFASMRSKSINKGNERTNISPRAPVPVRVRSHAYTSYHQQTAGRNSSLLVQGFASSPPSVGRPMESLKDVVVRKRELSQPIDNAATLNGSVEPTEYLDGPRPPKQAVFSIRSQTEVASMTMNESAAMTPPIGLPGEETLGLPITHTPIPTTAHITEVDDTRPTAELGADADERADASDGCRLVGNHGIIDLDGEVVELGPIKIECLANLINIICPPWLNESQSARVGTMPVVKVPESIAGSLSRGGSVLSFNV
ncbi:Sphingosine kinase 1 [Coemansia aciculifera]|uniref:Sphingosine kinase 1 n=1 Tax=Coemansia aciculifera TaxID=417176 RepID=A0A9W8M3R1_9FUNG|nr:Sphingosine kinase 1 [Coemansia aciculifera]KAJ2874115.1 Sphingosine kinase 1 [Coemansia aciculifera]